MRSVRLILLLCAWSAAWGAPPAVHQLRIEYRRGPSGSWTAFVRNLHSAPATAYIVQATFRHDGRQDATAFGGDTLGYAGGFDALAAQRETDTGHTLPENSTPVGATLTAAIYGDGFSEGDENVIEMLLSGRHRAYADLHESLPKLEQAASGSLGLTALQAYFESLRGRDMAESASLDQLIQIPGIRHRYFMGAVPMQALNALQNPRESASAIAGLLAQFRQWQQRLAQSKPDVR